MVHTVDAYTNPYTFPQFKNNFVLDDTTFNRWLQDGDKYFEALIVPKPIALTILGNSHNLQGQAGTIQKHIALSNRFLSKAMFKDIDKFIQN